VNHLNQLLKGVNLYLIGMMGSGKSTLAQLLATQLDYRFFDTDTLIETVARQSIAEIFDRDGEETFRQIESQVLAEISAYRRCAIATGGGIILKRMNWSYLRHGIVVWIDVPIAQLCDRLQGDTTRPLLSNTDLKAKLDRLLEERRDLYHQADVHLIVEPEETPEDTVKKAIDAIVRRLQIDEKQRDETQN
jgi:shikimate kinase